MSKNESKRDPCPWKNEEEYMAAWVWPSTHGNWYCRTDGKRYGTRDEAVEVTRRRDMEAGIVWPWNLGNPYLKEGQSDRD